MLLNVRLMVFVAGFFFIIHNSSLVCMVGITHVYIDTLFVFYGYIFFKPIYLYCLVGCLSMIVWTHAVFGCLICMCFVFLYLHLFSTIEHVSHGKAL